MTEQLGIVEIYRLVDTRTWSFVTPSIPCLFPFPQSRMRQSVAPNRASSLNASGGSAAAQAKLIEKKKEYDAVAALERASALYLERIQGLADDCDVMANAGEGTFPIKKKIQRLTRDRYHSVWTSPCTMAQNVSGSQPLL